jgi:bifunctional non-homologous end joining protein LigD
MDPDLKPMLATPSTSAGGRKAIDIADLDGTHVFDLKMDGVRAFFYWDGAKVRIVNRNGVNVTYKFPELVAEAEAHFDLPVWLDGEIVCDTGRFEDTLTRDKQATPANAGLAAARIPVTFHAFDWPLLHEYRWLQRRELLDAFLSDLPDSVRFVGTPFSEDSDFLDRTREVGLEGVIAKAQTSTYHFGRRSPSWRKFKNLHRVSCLVSGYEPGTGARSHFGKMNLAMIAPDGTVQPCGSVGTGFTHAEIWELKALLDAGQVLVGEIECLNRTAGGTLRFPVWKGRRLDVDVLSCTTDQLDALPAC